MVDAAHRLLEQDALAQRLGELAGQLLRAAEHAVLLGAVADARQAHDAAAGVDVEQKVQKREFVGLGREDGAHGEVERRSRPAGLDVLALPRLHGQRVPLLGVFGIVRTRQRHLIGQPVDAHDGELQVDEAPHRQRRDGVLVGGQLAVDGHAFSPVFVLREGVDAELVGQGDDPVLGGTDPLAAQVDGVAVRELLAQGASADAVARLQQGDVDTSFV